MLGSNLTQRSCINNPPFNGFFPAAHALQCLHVALHHPNIYTLQLQLQTGANHQTNISIIADSAGNKGKAYSTSFRTNGDLPQISLRRKLGTGDQALTSGSKRWKRDKRNAWLHVRSLFGSLNGLAFGLSSSQRTAPHMLQSYRNTLHHHTGAY